MTRRLLNVVTALSLLLCVALVALWVRGIHAGDTVLLKKEGERAGAWEKRYWQAYSSDGSIRLCRGVERWTDPDDAAVLRAADRGANVAWSAYSRGRGPPRSSLWTALGADLSRVLTGNGAGYSHAGWQLTLPNWALLLAAAALPAARAVHWASHRRRRRTGLCHSCGYDLRATPDRCPECGTAATTPA